MKNKRIFDLALTVPSIVILGPLMLAIACWIKIDSPGPVMFRQTRVGLKGRLFQILKFRTMAQDAERFGAKITVGGDPRITRSGMFLRKFKLDEIPQLINVFKGEMSLVGPRPEVPEYVAHWPAGIREIVLSVQPGITDFAAIEFRNEGEILSGAADPVQAYMQEIVPIKLSYYVRYVQEHNFWLDLNLILKTLSVIFKTDRSD